MLLILVALVFMYVGRKIGWALSRFLYLTPVALSLLGAVLWGVGIAASVSYLVSALHPNLIVKWVFGYALGAYVAIPNYGLFDKATLPDSYKNRDLMISNAALGAYVVAEFVIRTKVNLSR